MADEIVQGLDAAIGARRDIRRFRPDPVPGEYVEKVLTAGHSAPSVGHSQPWRFIVVTHPGLRDRAAHMADRERIRQASGMTPDRAARLLDLKLEGIREAPLGVVVACDRRAAAAGVLGRATFPDTDLWSCACAIENMWLTARTLGLGMGWVTLFEPGELAELLGLPDGVETLGWLCLGWPDERPPEPGLARAAWSRRLPLDQVVMRDGWQEHAPPDSHVRGPAAEKLVTATDSADAVLTPPDALGVLDRAVTRVSALTGSRVRGGSLILAGADHPVVGRGVSAFEQSVTRDVLTAAVEGRSAGAVAARAAGLEVVVVDAGVAGGAVPGALDARVAGPTGDLVATPAMSPDSVEALLDRGRAIGESAAATGIVALGEVGIGNTTVAGSLACALLGLRPSEVAGLGVGADDAIVARKRQVMSQALARAGSVREPMALLAELGGPEIAVLTGVALGAAAAGSPVVLDGLATSVAAALAIRMEAGVQAYLIAGQQSREMAHGALLADLGLEPLLQLRLRAGEGVGACLATSLLLQGTAIRAGTARTVD
ncbi:5,6-dimethylbenzimidazole synthase [Flexivirga meconopsidis]|uniref:5,6-dimethylbenzimidazole synthase n=1 Tax=Flexivirga meconopsidis TaxID=2977121 RepID=UPI0022407433|nr:5,6-dimethylbenzimidazole synthase [Flexivirga meconopsidis]